MASTSIPQLQLPTLTPLEPLTHGTNLPTVAASELEPPKPIPSPIETSKPATPAPNDDVAAANGASHMSPPSSPGKPASVRRFLSRVSLNSSYHYDDQASVMSSPGSDGKKKKASWWKKKVKRHSTIPAAAAGGLEGLGGGDKKQVVQSIPPPPRLPDDMFGKDLAEMDGDMFKNLK